MLINIILVFTSAPTMNLFTVINSPETDSMSVIHCCTIKSLFCKPALPSWQHHNLKMSHNLLHTERWTSSDAPELQNLRWRLFDASVAAVCTQTHTITVSFPIPSFFSAFSPVRARQRGYDHGTLRKPWKLGLVQRNLVPHKSLINAQQDSLPFTYTAPNPSTEQD